MAVVQADFAACRSWLPLAAAVGDFATVSIRVMYQDVRDDVPLTER